MIVTPLSSAVNASFVCLTYISSADIVILPTAIACCFPSAVIAWEVVKVTKLHIAGQDLDHSLSTFVAIRELFITSLLEEDVSCLG